MTIAIASGKGGVGKSMLASSLAILFSGQKKVVAVDADVDAPNLHLWLGQVPKSGVAHFSARRERVDEDNFWDEIETVSTNERAVIDQSKCDLCGKCVDICAFSVLSISEGELKLNPFFCEGCGACEAVCPRGAIYLEPVNNAEIKFKKEIKGVPLFSAQLYPGQTGSGKIVDELLARAGELVSELTLIDCPAGTGCPVIAALKDVDYVVLVTEPTPSGLSDLQRVLQVVDYFGHPFGVVVNKWDIDAELSERIERKFAKNFLGKISYNKEVFEAIASLTPIMETDLPQKREIEKICARLQGLLEK